MRWPHGLYAKSLLVIAVVLLLVLGIALTLLQRQRAMLSETRGLGRQAMHALVMERLVAHGKAEAVQVARDLANPMYYFDLDTIGSITRNALHQPDVTYVLVYDASGNVIHDGSGDIAAYGQAMHDPLAYEAINANALHVQWTNRVLDVSMPVVIGEQRLGGVRIGYTLSAIETREAQASQELSARVNQAGRRHLIWMIPLLLSLLALFAGIAWLVQRALVRPIRQLAEAARQIERGDFAIAVPNTQRNDEVGELVRAFDRMSQSIVRHDRDVRRMAYTDVLTGLSNRLAFREELDQRLLRLRGAGRQLALLFADIDDFKRVNDSLGHDAGDEVLVQFAARIEAVVERAGQAMLARFGGDEFVILLEQPDNAAEIRSAASALATELVTELGKPIQVQHRQVFLGTSVGITLFPEDASVASVLMKNGDIAMYQAKVAGKGCYRFYSKAMDQAFARRVHMEHDLRGAWARGELSLVYQPIFDLADRHVVGAEALLRWTHAIHGAIAPSVFIDVAEQSGLIEEIGSQVLTTACRDAARWGRALPDHAGLFVSVNLSSRQLRSGDLPHMVIAATRDAGLDASLLHLELTETAVIADKEQATALLLRLRSNGIKIWLDDFGTGFSGLSYLRQVPVDGVKIDRSFIADILRDPDDLALTTAIIGMAHSLGITVVAEGVEKEGQYDLLRARGCDLGQGYWLGQPIPSGELLALVQATNI